ncbi:hypothetical protein C7M84_018610 [Penaeus vannamei]|uniref:Uncharacterized protein n=1 Tax=Penaeus vannamei TaxID=6689 RepID=A0A423SGY4_PENVA|nr:hypothetical protein C7M84_018610 [Penaeus vannamei]
MAVPPDRPTPPDTDRPPPTPLGRRHRRRHSAASQPRGDRSPFLSSAMRASPPLLISAQLVTQGQGGGQGDGPPATKATRLPSLASRAGPVAGHSRRSLTACLLHRITASLRHQGHPSGLEGPRHSRRCPLGRPARLFTLPQRPLGAPAPQAATMSPYPNQCPPVSGVRGRGCQSPPRRPTYSGSPGWHHWSAVGGGALCSRALLPSCPRRPGTPLASCPRAPSLPLLPLRPRLPSCSRAPGGLAPWNSLTLVPSLPPLYPPPVPTTPSLALQHLAPFLPSLCLLGDVPCPLALGHVPCPPALLPWGMSLALLPFCPVECPCPRTMAALADSCLRALVPLGACPALVPDGIPPRPSPALWDLERKCGSPESTCPLAHFPPNPALPPS